MTPYREFVRCVRACVRACVRTKDQCVRWERGDIGKFPPSSSSSSSSSSPLEFDLLSKMLLTGFRQLRFPCIFFQILFWSSENLARRLFRLHPRTRVQSIKRF